MSHENKEFDLIVFGASGFTGRLVAEYLAQHDEKTGPLRWAMAGRSISKLEQVRAELGLPDTLPVIAANTEDPQSVADMVARAACIVTTVGPYQLYGTSLLAACDALDIQPREAIFLDDLGINLKPAHALGMTTIKVIKAETAIAELSAHLGHELP